MQQPEIGAAISWLVVDAASTSLEITDGIAPGRRGNMAKFQGIESHLQRDRFASLLALEIERTVAIHCEARQGCAIGPVGVVAGNIAAAITLLTPVQQRAIKAINDDLSDIAKEFVRELVEMATNRGPTGDSQRYSQVSSDGLSNGRRPQSLVPGLDLKSIDDWAGPVAGQTFLEAELQIPRSTLHLWQRQNDVIALRKGARKHVFPLTQFVDGRPAPGIRKVLAHISNPRSAWSWMIAPCPELEGRVPIEMLKGDLVDEVLSAVGNRELNHVTIERNTWREQT